MKYISASIVFILLCKCAFAQIPSYVDTNGLLAWYPFDASLDNVYTSPVNNGVGYGTIVYDTDRYGSAYHCYRGNGINGIDIPDNNFPTGNDARSISVFFKSAVTYPGGLRQLIAWGDTAIQGGKFGILLSDTSVAVEYNKGAVYKKFTPDNNWHNIAVTYPVNGTGSSSVKLYFDGVLSVTVIQGPVTIFTTDTGSVHCIGTLSPSSSQNSWSGYIDDLGIWNRELTPCEIQHLFSGISTLHITIDSGTNICNKGTGFVKANVMGGTPPYQYQWSAQSTYTPSPNEMDSLSSGTYSVLVTDTNGCTATKAATVTDFCPPVTVATGMSPNGDGINDSWEISGLENYPDNTVQVFDKWGNLVYEQGNYKSDWSGKSKVGSLLPDGIYHYLVKLNTPAPMGQQNVLTGPLVLKR